VFERLHRRGTQKSGIFLFSGASEKTGTGSKSDNQREEVQKRAKDFHCGALRWRLGARKKEGEKNLCEIQKAGVPKKKEVSRSA